MEKRVFGIILTILGIAGLILGAVSFVNSTDSNQGTKVIITYGILGLIFFFSGIGLLRNTSDNPRL
jgi:uncharacterized membrane protein